MAGGLHRPDEDDELPLDEDEAATVVRDDGVVAVLEPVTDPAMGQTAAAHPPHEEQTLDETGGATRVQARVSPPQRASAQSRAERDELRALEISGPAQPVLSGGPVPQTHRTQLDAPMRVGASFPVALAVLFHVSLLLFAIFLPKLLGVRSTRSKPLIAKLVVMGKPRDQKLMPRLPTPTSAPPPSPVSVPASPLTQVQPKVAATQPKPSEPKPKALSREELMNRALAQATRGVDQERHELKPEEREGKEDGSPLGTAATAEEGDQYFAAVQAAILENYLLPSIISERDRMALKATVDAWIAKDGTITRYVFEQRSGNHFFDEALELAIKRTKVPPPPADRAAAVARDGVALVFTP